MVLVASGYIERRGGDAVGEVVGCRRTTGSVLHGGHRQALEVPEVSADSRAGGNLHVLTQIEPADQHDQLVVRTSQDSVQDGVVARRAARPDDVEAAAALLYALFVELREPVSELRIV